MSDQPLTLAVFEEFQRRLFANLDARFDSIDARFDRNDGRFDSPTPRDRLDRMEPGFECELN